jgi:hypothetical protein
MGAVGVLALLANGVCFALLYRHRADDLNMRSTWLAPAICRINKKILPGNYRPKLGNLIGHEGPLLDKRQELGVQRRFAFV